MGEIFSNRWTQKNGATPSDLWIAQIGAMTEAQLKQVCGEIMNRCVSGSTWPPDLAEFVSLVADTGANPFGLTVEVILKEYKQWRNEDYRYGGSVEYPWKQPVLYHICIELKRVGYERRLTDKEFERFAEKLLAKWIKYVTSGLTVPPIRRQIAPPRHPSGPTPAQLLYAEYLRRKAAQQ
jgi:hypothetical protein